jgi:hypothetical protein
VTIGEAPELHKFVLLSLLPVRIRHPIPTTQRSTSAFVPLALTPLYRSAFWKLPQRHYFATSSFAFAMADPEGTRSSNPDINPTHTDQPQKYDPAFNEKDANIVLRSSDGTLYRIPSFTLRTTSGFFRDMMTLPEGDGASAGRDDDCITLGETSKVLGILLRMISGFETPKWESIDEVEDVLAAARKYDMPGPLSTIRSAIVGPLFLDQSLKVYAIAAKQDWEEEAKEASKHSLRLSIYDTEHASTLQQVPSSYLLRLFALHRGRQDQFKALSAQNGGCFGLSTKCGYCGHTQNWLPIIQRVLLEMDRRPLGDTFLGRQWMDWPEKDTFVKGSCGATISCVNFNHNQYELKIATFLETSLKLLPTMI